jgi:hypothetical protein
MGHQKIDIANSQFELERLQLDVKELERVGPLLLLDLRSAEVSVSSSGRSSALTQISAFRVFQRFPAHIPPDPDLAPGLQ